MARQQAELETKALPAPARREKKPGSPVGMNADRDALVDEKFTLDNLYKLQSLQAFYFCTADRLQALDSYIHR